MTCDLNIYIKFFYIKISKLEHKKKKKKKNYTTYK